MVGASTTFKYVFDHRQSDIYWCTADCGWITGHSYVTYGEAAPQTLPQCSEAPAGAPCHGPRKQLSFRCWSCRRPAWRQQCLH